MAQSSADPRKELEVNINNAKLILAGGIAGCVSKTTVAPLDRCKILLQTHHHHFKNFGLRQTARGVYEREGLAGFYHSNGAQMLRIFPYAAIQFFSYEKYKKLLKGSRVALRLKNADKLCAGSMAGITCVLCTYPLDVVRARLAFQLSSERVYRGIGHAFSSIVAQEGVRGLYRGIVPSLVGMAPYAGTSFYTFESLKELVLLHLPHLFAANFVEGAECTDVPQTLTTSGRLLCGCVAGAFAQTVSYPLDVVRRQMQVEKMVRKIHDCRRSWVHTLVRVYRENGVRRGLYRGLSITYLRASPMVAMSFTTYESLKQLFRIDVPA